MPFLIDGHNLIPRLGLDLGSIDDEMELVRHLEDFCRSGQRQAQVFFDGAPPGQDRSQRFGRVTAHFVRQGRTADAAILDELHRLGRQARNVTVVSSDRAVQAAARRLHAAVLSSEDFARQIQEPAPAPPSTAPDTTSDQEIEEWLRQFGAGDKESGQL